MEMKKKMEKKVTNIGLVAILVIAVFAAVMGIASAQTQANYNENGNYIEGINVSVNTSDNLYFNRSCINDPLTFQINNTLNPTAANFNVTTQLGLTTNATGILSANERFWVNASSADTYWVNVSNNDSRSEYVNFTVEYLPCLLLQTCEIKPETLNLGSKGVVTAFITLPEGYSVEDKNNITVNCEGVLAVKVMIDGDTDGDTIIAKFNKQDFKQDLVGVSTDGEVTLTVTGKLNDGTLFKCNNTIRVIDRGRWGSQWFNGFKKWGKGVLSAFGIADEAASPPDTTPPVPTNAMHIDNISMWHTTAGPNYKIYTKVRIVDSNNVGVAGATVYLNTTLPDDTNVSSSGDTVDDDGTVEFKYGPTKTTGDYISTVTSVAKEGGTYNSSANEDTSDSITV